MKRGEVAAGSQWALVTGGSSGIGLAIARKLVLLGYNIIIAGDREDKLESAANILRLDAQYSDKIEVKSITIDLATDRAAQKLFEESKKIANVNVLVNNAGMFSFLDILNTPTQRIERIIYLHDMTIALSCKLFATDMQQRNAKGYILNMASYSQWMPFPGLAIYSASKAFVNSFSVAFAKEVQEHSIKVTAVCPAGVATDLYGLPANLQRLGTKLGVLLTVESCAHRALNALWHGKKSIVPDWWNRLFIPFCKHMPPFITNPLRKATMKIQH